MRQKKQFSIICNSKKKEEKIIYYEFKEKLKKYLCHEVMELYYIPIDSEEYFYAHDLAQKYPYDSEKDAEESAGLYIYERETRETTYQKKDFQKAEAYLIRFCYFAYFYDDMTAYEFDGPCCLYSKYKTEGDALVQKRPILLPASEFRNKKYAVMYEGFAVAEEIVQLLENHGLADREDFWEIKNKQGKLVAYQIWPKNVVEGFAKDNNMELYDQCENCGLKWYEPMEEPYYISKQTLERLKGLNKTEEMIGGEPYYIVNKETYTLLHQHYPRMQFIPLFPKENGIYTGNEK